MNTIYICINIYIYKYIYIYILIKTEIGSRHTDTHSAQRAQNKEHDTYIVTS